MNDVTRHALMRTRYILVNRKIFPKTFEAQADECIVLLTRALDEFPPQPKPRRTEREWIEIEEIGS